MHPTSDLPDQLNDLFAQLAGIPYYDPDDIIRPIQWDWPGWLSPGFLTILAGQPGIGKSTLCLHLATSYLLGRPWPDGAPFTLDPGNTLWIESKEDDHRLKRQRLKSWGQRHTHILIFSLEIDPLEPNSHLADQHGLRSLTLSAMRPDVRLIVLDSLDDLLAGVTTPNLIHDLFTTLTRIARFVNKPFLITQNLYQPITANRGRLNLARVLGSSDIARIPRLIWALDLPDPAHPAHRRLSAIKNNLALSPDPLTFRIGDHGLHFDPPSQPPRSQLAQAMDFLTSYLAGGPLPAAQVKAAAQAAGHTLPTLKRAKKQLRLKSHKHPNQWLWQLPPEEGR